MARSADARSAMARFVVARSVSVRSAVAGSRAARSRAARSRGAGSQGAGSRGGRRGLLCGALLLGLIAVTACGSVRAPAGTTAAAARQLAAADHARPAQLVLCADPAAASRVVISRTAVIRQIQPGKNLPSAQVTIASGARARILATALCALPRMPKGAFNCPAQFFGHDALKFTAGGRQLPTVTVLPTGCQTVTGLGPVRWVAKNPGFWTVLDRAAAAAGPVRSHHGPTIPS